MYPRVGQRIDLPISSPLDPGADYVALASFGIQNGLPIGGRLFALDFDPLLQSSLSLPSIFIDFIGRLDANGTGQCAVQLPNMPGLVGLELYTAYLLIDPTMFFGIGGMSNAQYFNVQ